MTDLFRQLYKIQLLLLLFVSGFVIVCLVFPSTSRLFEPNKARQKINRIKLTWLSVFSAILNLDITIEGEATSSPALIVSNHISWLDIVVLGCHLPGYFVAKSDILHWPVIGYLSRQAGTIFVQRTDRNTVYRTTEQMSWLLKQNSNVFVFPEGTTSDGREVRPFHSALFQPALLTRTIIQPIAIQYEGASQTAAPFVGDDAFIPHLLKILTLKRVKVVVKILPPLEIGEKKRSQLCNEAHTHIRHALQSDTTRAEFSKAV